MITFTVLGAPVPKGRPRVVARRRKGGGMFPVAITPERTVQWEQAVRRAAEQARITPMTGPVRLTCAFFLPTRRRVDIDNLGKAVMDALNGIAFADDSQVFELATSKRLDAKAPRVVVGLWPCEGWEPAQ